MREPQGSSMKSARGQAQSKTFGRSRRGNEAEIGPHEPPRYLGGYGDYMPSGFGLRLSSGAFMRNSRTAIAVFGRVVCVYDFASFLLLGPGTSLWPPITSHSQTPSADA